MGALLAMLLAASAWGASFDCARAMLPVERAVCADAALSALDDRLGEAYRRNMAAPWAAMMREAQRVWLAERNNFAGHPDILRRMYDRQVAMLEEAAAVQGHGSHRGLTAEQVGGTCIALPPDPEAPEGAVCRVAESGVPGMGQLDGRPLRYARYSYPDPARPDAILLAGTATVLFAEGADGRWAPVFADRRGVTACAAPRLFRGAQGVTLHLPCHQYGTGNINFESLYAWRGGQWRELDVESWTHALRERLPRGLEAWKGIYPDYRALTARTPLWRPGDGNCCPTGGRAEITLAWEGDRLMLRDLRVILGRAAAEQ